MMDLGDALRDYARLFESLRLRYAVMGGIAVRVYGIPRPTHDIDFTVAVPRDRLRERPRDIADVGDILFTQGQLDEAYMRLWARQLGVLDPLEKILSEHPPI